MSWLYSIVFAGLLLSSDGDTKVNKTEAGLQQMPAVYAGRDEIEKFEQSYPLSANGRVSVSNVNGSIVVEAWDKNEVRLEATKIADSKETLSDVEIKVDSSPDSFSVETDYKEWKWSDKGDKSKDRHRKLEVQFKLSVPRTAVLDEIETVNGSVTVTNFVNSTKISAVNGNVNAGNLRGAANLSTVNGEVIADFDRLEQGSKINLSTVNGSVNLTIPSDANATIKADSLNGNITNEFGLPVRKGEYVGRDLYGKIGSGEVQIKLDSVNGPLAINRKKDGKSPNPATNLLQNKRGNSDWDNDSNGVNINTRQIDRDVARAVRDAEKASAIASKEAVKAMKNVNLAELKNLKIDIDSKEIERQIQVGMKHQLEAMARIRDANWMDESPVVERKTNSFAVKGSPKITVDAKKCTVRVRGWDKQEVRYVLTEFSGHRDRTPATVTEEQTASGISLKVVTVDHDDSENSRLEIFVPRKSDLKISAEGEIRLEGVSGSIELIGDKGAIDVRGSDGKLNISNTDGTVRIIGFRGDLIAKTESGEVYMDGDFNQISGDACDGKFVLTLPENIDADIETPGEHFVIEDLPNNKQISDTNWRFGKGGRKYTFSGTDGSLVVQNRDIIGAEK
jgi:DUF4097 and DUF4098 domain-containing protein YvlB